MKFAQRASSERSCPYCREAISNPAEAQACVGCQTGYHTSCVDEFGRCSTLGCAGEAFESLSPEHLGQCAACSRSIERAAERSECPQCRRAYHLRCHAGSCVHGCDQGRGEPLLSPRATATIVTLGAVVALIVAARTLPSQEVRMLGIVIMMLLLLMGVGHGLALALNLASPKPEVPAPPEPRGGQDVLAPNSAEDSALPPADEPDGPASERTR